jgi:flagellar hook-associated protein 2
MDTDRSTTLAGDSTVRTLQSRIQVLGASKVFEEGSVRTLADLGIETQSDGTLAIDTSTLTAAIGRDPGRVNALFADATAGVSKLTSSLVSDFTSAGTGLLIVRQSGLRAQMRSMDSQAASMQTRLDAYRQSLLAQFNSMEQVVSGYKSLGNFLNQLSSLSSK